MATNVLIVDDNDDCAFLTKLLVTETGSKVHIATTVDEAIQELTTHTFRLVITDFNFPIGGFPSLLPALQKKSQCYILNSSDPSIIKTYDSTLQLGAIVKGANYVSGMRSLLRNLKI